MNPRFPLYLPFLLGLTACDPTAARHEDAAALRGSLTRLSVLETRVFDAVRVDGATGRIVQPWPQHDLQAIAQDARESRLTGCAGPARDALPQAIDHMTSALRRPRSHCDGSGVAGPGGVSGERWRRARGRFGDKGMRLTGVRRPYP